MTTNVELIMRKERQFSPAAIVQPVFGLASILAWTAVAVAVGLDNKVSVANLIQVAKVSLVGPVMVAGLGVRLAVPNLRVGLCWAIGLGAAVLCITSISIASGVLPFEHWSRSPFLGLALDTSVLLGFLVGTALVLLRLTDFNAGTICCTVLCALAGYDFLFLLADIPYGNPNGPADASLFAGGAVLLIVLTRRITSFRSGLAN